MFAMNPPPTVGLKTLIIFGLSFVKQLAHGLVKRFAGYVTLLNAFALDRVLFQQSSDTLGQLVHIKWLLNKATTASFQYFGGLAINTITA